MPQAGEKKILVTLPPFFFGEDPKKGQELKTKTLWVYHRTPVLQQLKFIWGHFYTKGAGQSFGKSFEVIFRSHKNVKKLKINRNIKNSIKIRALFRI